MTFLVVSSMVSRILVAVLLHLVAETVMSLVGLVVHPFIFQFVVDIVVLTYAAIMM